MAEFEKLLLKIEADLRAQGESETEIQRLLALPRSEIGNELRRRAARQQQEANELEQYVDQKRMAEAVLGPGAKVKQNIARKRGKKP